MKPNNKIIQMNKINNKKALKIYPHKKKYLNKLLIKIIGVH